MRCDWFTQIVLYRLYWPSVVQQKIAWIDFHQLLEPINLGLNLSVKIQIRNRELKRAPAAFTQGSRHAKKKKIETAFLHATFVALHLYWHHRKKKPQKITNKRLSIECVIQRYKMSLALDAVLGVLLIRCWESLTLIVTQFRFGA